MEQQVHRSSACLAERLDTFYPPRRASAAPMRAALRAYLADQAVDVTVASQVVLAADEAFINAITHSGSRDVIRVVACVAEGEASVEVRDGGHGFAYRRSGTHSVPDALRPSGRGVFLIESMMDDVSVKSGRGGTTVRMVRHLD